MTPVTTYAQNNGVISLSRCASRQAGFACCIWLLVLGIFSKFAAIILSIPNCVLGGMTTFLFTSVVVSGIHVLNLKEGLKRRNRFIVIIALGIGLGVNLVPSWVNISGQSNYPFQGNLWPVNPRWSPSYRGFRDAIILIFEENGCSRTDGQRVADSTYATQSSAKECFSFTPESSMKKVRNQRGSMRPVEYLQDGKRTSEFTTLKETIQNLLKFVSLTWNAWLPYNFCLQQL